MRYPEGWPVDSYSLIPLRAAVHAESRGLLKEISHALYHQTFALGRALTDPEAVLDAAESVGLGRSEVRRAIEDPEIKERLRAATDAAMDAGVTGVPTVVVGERLFWGDDRLEEAAAAARSSAA